jgi:hypothetical protein
MKCLYCLVNKEENPEINKNSQDYQLIAIEKPYVNLFFHKECLNKIENIITFLTENTEIWYNYSVQR